MFPSANYFREIPCPFFSRVACPRPHCHFKHTQTSSQTSNNTNTSSVPLSSSTSSLINIPPDANETLNKLINQLSNAAPGNATQTTTTATTNVTSSIDISSILQSTLLQSLTAFANVLNSTPQTTTAKNETSEKLTQALTTIATQLNQHQTQTQTAPTKNVNNSIPEYRPTPIVELERRRRGHPQTVPVTIKTEKLDFDSDEYIQATFSPPANSSIASSLEQSERAEGTNPKTSTVSKVTQPTSAQTNSKPSNTDDNHSWITPPMRRKLSSSSDHNDFDERKPPSVKKIALSESIQSSKKINNKPIATVKPNVLENANKTTSSTNSTLKRISNKTMPSSVRVADIDLDKVPVTPTISIDITKNLNKKATSLKRLSNGIDETPQKKAKLTSSTTTTGSIIKKQNSLTNGINKIKKSDEDDELELFDKVFPTTSKSSEIAIVSKKSTSTLPPNSIQQFTSRYSSLTSTSSSSPTTTSTSHTRAETSTDGRRVAHQPKIQPHATNTSFTPLLQPLVDANSSSNKIPFKTRQEYLTFFLNELKNRPTNPNDATPKTPVYARAQSIEKEMFDKSTNKNSYLNLAAKYLRQLRSGDINTKTINETSLSKKPNVQRLVVSHSAMLTGGRTDNVSFGIKKQKEIDIKTLTDNELYTLLLAHKASEKDLTENGYPAFSLDFPNKVLIKNKNPIYNATIKTLSSDPFTRVCCRCSKTYKIDQNSEYIKQEDCIYHWGRMRSQRIAGHIEKTFSCCSGKTNSIGCAIAKYHVSDSDDTQLLSGYVKTQPLRKQLATNESYGIYAIDCEMCYTIDGVELVRVSVVDHKLQSVYETLVKPHRTVLDYNTRWSGITENQLKDCTVTLEDVQKHLLKLFNDKTILIGHSLESDLKALKIVHETNVDTSLVFPHAKGKPYKRALKTLMSEFLTKIIQENVNGHNSIEDAMSCMELMLWKVKDDLKNTSSTR